MTAVPAQPPAVPDELVERAAHALFVYGRDPGPAERHWQNVLAGRSGMPGVDHSNRDRYFAKMRAALAAVAADLRAEARRECAAELEAWANNIDSMNLYDDPNLAAVSRRLRGLASAWDPR